MSLLLILRKIWRYKIVTIPIVALVIAGGVYVVAVQPPTYETSATYMLIPPPTPPTNAQIKQNPEPGHAGDDNPYSRLSDPSVLVSVLSSQLSSDAVRRSLAAEGVTSMYTAEPSAAFGFSAPILEITGTGTTAAAAVRTTNLVGRAMTQGLDQMQRVRGVDPAYRITTEAVVPPADATLKASGKLRSLVAVFVLGTILLFITISVLDAVGAVRRERRQADDAEDASESESTSPLAPRREASSGTPKIPPRPIAGWDRPMSALDPDALPWTGEANR